MKPIERRAASLDAFRKLDPEGQGVYLAEVAEHVAQKDEWFMRRYNARTKIMSIVGMKRRPGDLGMAYLPKMYAPAAHFEQNEIVHSHSEGEEGSESANYPRRRIYRYLGVVGLDRAE